MGGPYPYDRIDLRADNFGGHLQLPPVLRLVQRLRKDSWLERPPSEKNEVTFIEDVLIW